jgi:ABC-type nitrate/sulfonate/bicarbonate transport system substrate-binding protein
MTRAGWVAGLVGVLVAVGCQPAPAAPSATAPAQQSAMGSAAAPTTAPVAAAQPAASPTLPAGATAATARAPLSPPVHVNMGVQGSTAENGYYLALERGYFREEGLEVEFTRFATAGDMIAPLASGALDVGSGGIGAGLFNAIAQGIPLKIVADHTINRPEDRAAAWMVRAAIADRVKEPSDVRGMAVGLGTVGSTVDVELDTILDLGGLTRDDIEIKAVSYADQVAAFANGSVDLAFVFEPQLTRLRQEGLARVWKTSGEIIPNHETAVLLYGPSLTQEKPEAAKRFMVAHLRGVRDAQKELGNVATRNKDTIRTVAKYTTITDLQVWEQLELPTKNPDGYNNRASIERDLRYFVDKGLVRNPPNLAEVIDQSYVDYALSVLGKAHP